MERSQAVSDTLLIWQAALRAIDPALLVAETIRLEGHQLVVDDFSIDLSRVGRIYVTGAGKASAAMAAGLEAILDGQAGKTSPGTVSPSALPDFTGQVVVPAGSWPATEKIKLIVGRESHTNLPTRLALAACSQIIDDLHSLEPSDLCIALISGGGSALLPAPMDPLTLEEKISATNSLAGQGLSIRELNVVRAALSRIKGGGLARNCRANRILGLIISDVCELPPRYVASGPTYPHSGNLAQEALAILKNADPARTRLPANVYHVLESNREKNRPNGDRSTQLIDNVVIGQNSTGLVGLALQAERLKYVTQTESLGADKPLDELAHRLARLLLDNRTTSQNKCFAFGGEVVLPLVAKDVRGRGGRCQQLALSFAHHLKELAFDTSEVEFCLLAAGTDGEDGPTDAAGAYIDRQFVDHNDAESILKHLLTNDAYPLLDKNDCLIKTGPTGTNVSDLICLLVRPNP